MAHEGGRQLSKQTGIPHVIDMRDPWSLIQRVQEDIASPVWLHLASRYERAAIRDAAFVSMNTEASAIEMATCRPAR